MAFDPSDPNDAALLKKAVDDAVSEANEGAAKKNRELLVELKEAKKGRTIDPAEIERLEAKADDLQTKLSVAEKATKDATTAAEKAVKALEAESGVTHRLLAENGLTSALSKAGVTDSAFVEALKAMHLPNVKVVADGDSRKALYGDKELEAAITEWAGSDVGKKFVTAPANGGGGASGGKGGEGGKTMARAAFDALDQGARMAFVKDGGKPVDIAA